MILHEDGFLVSSNFTPFTPSSTHSEMVKSVSPSFVFAYHLFFPWLVSMRIFRPPTSIPATTLSAYAFAASEMAVRAALFCV